MFFFTVEYLRKMRIFTLIYSKLNIHEREMKSLICLSALLLFACTSIPIQSNLTDETRKVIDSLIRVTPGIDSLAILLDNYTGDENKYGMMRASSELGKRYRETAKFNEAVVCHRQALGLAEQLGDTVEIIQICNQIGTNFRRMGIMDEASTYHYKALALCEQRQKFLCRLEEPGYFAQWHRERAIVDGELQCGHPCLPSGPVRGAAVGERPGAGDQLCQYRRNLRKAGYDRLGLDLLSSFHAAQSGGGLQSRDLPVPYLFRQLVGEGQAVGQCHTGVPECL